MRLESGTRLGPYEIVELLGAGGMGEVYRARDSRLGREVAVKIVSEPLGADGEALERFEREARLSGSLSDPNVVALYDVGSHQGMPFFVTELLRGQTLRGRLEAGHLSLAATLDIAAQVASGLAAAHERGIAHRDLKPENVFLTRDGHAKLVDFGIAKAMEAALEPSGHGLLEKTAPPSPGGTRAGAVFGSPGYMSPEQVRGERVDPRTDFFSFGAVLYEMLTGRRAFPGSPAVSAHATLQGTVPELPPDIPDAVGQVVHRCLEKDPERRFQSARDLAFHLDVLRSARRERAHARRRIARVWLWAGLVLLSAIAVAVPVTIQLRRTKTNESAAPHVQQLTFTRGQVFTARFGPDGKQVLFSGSWEGEPARVYSTTLDRPDFHPLPLESAELLAISPKGDLAVSLRPAWRHFEDGGRGTLASVPLVGGAPRELLDAVSYADWSPDGANLAVVHQVESSSLLEFPIGQVLHRSSGWLSHPRVSPRGDQVAFIDHPSLYDYPGELMLVDTAGHGRVLARSTANIAGVAWSPRGDEVWFTRDDEAPMSIWAVSLDGALRLVYRGTNDLILEDIAADGRALVISIDRRAKTVVARPGNEPVKDLSWLDQSILDDISADGATILFSENDRIANLRKTDGSAPVHLGNAKALALSPDGKWVLGIRAHETPESRRLLMLPTGVGVGRSIELKTLRLIRRARFAPDGRHVAVIARADGAPGFAVHWVDRETGQHHPITTPDLEGYFLEISPDGGKVATVGRGGVLTVVPVSGGPSVPLSEPGEPWVPAGWDGNGALFARRLYDVPASVFRVDLTTSARQPIATAAPLDTSGVGWISRLKVAAASRTIGFSYPVSQSKVLLLSWGGSPSRNDRPGL